MNKIFIIPYLLLLSCSLIQSDIFDVFCLFCISCFLNLHSKSLKRGAVFPPLSVGLQCTFLSCIFVQCCAFERWVLCTVSPLLQFSLVPTFVFVFLKRTMLNHRVQNIINIMPNFFGSRTNLSNLYKMFHLTDILCQLVLDWALNFNSCRLRWS